MTYKEYELLKLLMTNAGIVTTRELILEMCIRDSYNGTVTNWKEIGGADEPIIVIGREAGSGTRGAFEELVDLKDACLLYTSLAVQGGVATLTERSDATFAGKQFSSADRE